MDASAELAQREVEVLERANGSFSQVNEPPLLPGERIILIAEPVTLISPMYPPVVGKTFVTNFKLAFQQKKKNNLQTKLESTDLNPCVPLTSISRVEKIGGQKKSRSETSYCLDFVCKDMRTLRFGFLPQNHSRRRVYDVVIQALNTKAAESVFAFQYKYVSTHFNGWKVYTHEKELKRMGVPNAEWRLCTLNSSYDLCATYPRLFALPASFSDDSVKEEVSFRSRCRLPALSWLHPRNGSSITRCSQPRVGMGRKRSSADEALLRAIQATNPAGDTRTLYIIDARPIANARVNQAMGSGFELVANYKGCVLEFMDISNIHVMRESLERIRDTLRDSSVLGSEDNKWLSGIHSSGWLDHVRLVLEGSKRIVELVDGLGCSVITHCSDGWDRTAQLTAISCLLLDPYYRTVEGFEVLIEKEWLSFGHKIAQRCGHFEDTVGKEDQRSPIFVQFIDCVYQLSRQFPSAFQFSSSFLITLLHHVYSCQFGTFLFNTERERVQFHLSEKSVSLWTFLNDEIYLRKNTVLLNPFYVPTEEVLYPITSPHMLSLWVEYYGRWNSKLSPLESFESQGHRLIMEINALKESLGK
eukprot:GCRY01006176.1.p1 GENE.GCRY01006176.1~~GCRY01006176.1.p1  ORF type:complete len:586 (-),score=46.52 GCRY01006176.1:330-2087(-)